MEGGVETTGYVAGLVIAIADVDELCMQSVGHGVLYKVLIRSRNGRAILSWYRGSLETFYEQR